MSRHLCFWRSNTIHIHILATGVRRQAVSSFRQSQATWQEDCFESSWQTLFKHSVADAVLGKMSSGSALERYSRIPSREKVDARKTRVICRRCGVRGRERVWWRYDRKAILWNILWRSIFVLVPKITRFLRSATLCFENKHRVLPFTVSQSNKQRKMLDLLFYLYCLCMDLNLNQYLCDMRSNCKM